MNIQYLNSFESFLSQQINRNSTPLGPLPSEAYNRTVTEQAEMPLGRPNR